MSGNKKLDVLFKTLGKALKTIDPQDISNAIVDFQKNKISNKQEVDSVIQLVSEEYAISVKSILTGPSNGKSRNAKFMVYVLLHIKIGLSVRAIAKQVFHNWHNSVNRGISYYNKCNPKIKQDREFLEVYNKLEEKINSWQHR